jgi:hypothetical protein
VFAVRERSCEKDKTHQRARPTSDRKRDRSQQQKKHNQQQLCSQQNTEAIGVRARVRLCLFLCFSFLHQQ